MKLLKNTFLSVALVSLIFGNGNAKKIDKRKDEVEPDCGEELCVPGYEMCLESRCRNCADFVNTEYGCENIKTLKECAAFCLDEMEKHMNITILSLEKIIFTRKENCTEEHSNTGSKALYIILGVVIGGTIGFLCGFFINPRRCSKDTNVNPANRLPLQIQGQLDLRDSRFSQIPASNTPHTVETQGLIAQESNGVP